MLAKSTPEVDPQPCSQHKWWKMSSSPPLVPAQALTPSASSNGALTCCSLRDYYLVQNVDADRVRVAHDVFPLPTCV